MANKFLIAAFILTIAIFVNGQSEAPNNSSEMASEESNSEESGSEEQQFNPFKFRPFFGPSSSNSSAPPPFAFLPFFGRMPSLFNRPSNRPSSDN
uniref:Esophageal gland-localized secretory protein 9 n=1 Tax=Heterodera glycines TaxID=51029 RepID=A0A0E3JCD2_HETGL|nr:esophageal gland-localized secretory protein 9 [Heterodera glycines]